MITNTSDLSRHFLIEKMITVSKSGESEKFPKSFMRIIKFYRVWGFSFFEPNNEKNKKLSFKLKQFLFIIHNVLVIFSAIICEYISSPESNQIFDILSSKPLMRSLYYVSTVLSYVDMISAFILSLLRGKKLIILLKTEDVLIFDTNTKRANMLIISKIIIISIISIICSYLWVSTTLGKNTTGFIRFLYLILAFYLNFILLIGVFVLPVIYSYMIWIIYSQIINLKNNISEGNIILYLSNSLVFMRIKNQSKFNQRFVKLTFFTHYILYWFLQN